MQRNVFMFEQVNAPYDSVRRVLRDEPGLILEPSALVSLMGVNEVVARLDASVGTITVADDVDVQFGEFEEVERGMTAMTRQVCWCAVDHRDWFPRFDGEFEAYPLSRTTTQLTFVGRYTPPGGLLGGVIDLVALHRVADSAIRTFFEHAVERLETLGAPAQVGQEPTP